MSMLEVGNTVFLIMAFVVLVAIGVTVLAIARHDNRRINRELRELEAQRREYRRRKARNARRIVFARKHYELHEQRRRRGEGRR